MNFMRWGERFSGGLFLLCSLRPKNPDYRPKTVSYENSKNLLFGEVVFMIFYLEVKPHCNLETTDD